MVSTPSGDGERDGGTTSLSRLQFVRPLLVSALAAIAACALLTYLVTEAQVLSLPEGFVAVVFPLLLMAWLRLGPWRRSVSHLGHPGERDGRTRTILLWAMMAGLGGCLVCLQLGLRLWMAQFVTLPGPAQLDSAPRARFVRLDSFEVAFGKCRPVWDLSSPSGPTEDVTLDLYVVCPFVPEQPNVWMAARHSGRVSHQRLADDQQREALLTAFTERADAAFRQQLPGQIHYFQRLGTDRIGRKLGTEVAALSGGGAPVILLATMTPYRREGHGLLLGSLLSAAGFLLVIARAPLGRLSGGAIGDPDAQARDGGLVSRRAAPAAGRPPWALFVPRDGAVATPLLLDANIALFLVMTLAGVDPLSPLVSDLVDYGANQRSLLLAGGWWRLLTHQFVHAGVAHLAMNCFVIAMASRHLESMAGWRWTLATYLVGGVSGGLLSAALQDVVSVGASGAALALVGAVLVLSYSRYGLGKGVGNWALVLAVANLLIGFKAGIDGGAHAGGLLAGMGFAAAVYGQYLRREERMRREQAQRWDATATNASTAGGAEFQVLIIDGARPVLVERGDAGEVTAEDLLLRLERHRHRGSDRSACLIVLRPIAGHFTREDLIIVQEGDAATFRVTARFGDWALENQAPTSPEVAAGLIRRFFEGPQGAVYESLRQDRELTAVATKPPLLGRWLDRRRAPPLWTPRPAATTKV